jgi:ferredoxin-like protein FixX
VQVKIDHKRLVNRVSGTGNFISMDNSRYSICGRCLIICVMNLWKSSKDMVYIIDDYASQCMECGACSQVCESDAIQFRYPTGCTGIVYEKG